MGGVGLGVRGRVIMGRGGVRSEREGTNGKGWG